MGGAWVLRACWICLSSYGVQCRPSWKELCCLRRHLHRNFIVMDVGRGRREAGSMGRRRRSRVPRRRGDNHAWTQERLAASGRGGFALFLSGKAWIGVASVRPEEGRRTWPGDLGDQLADLLRRGPAQRLPTAARASRIRGLAASPQGIMGRRSSSAQRPSSARANLVGEGEASANRALSRRTSRSCH